MSLAKEENEGNAGGREERWEGGGLVRGTGVTCGVGRPVRLGRRW